jgi:hypothetical protein
MCRARSTTHRLTGTAVAVAPAPVGGTAVAPAPVGVALTTVGVAPAPVGVALTKVGVAMAPVGVALLLPVSLAYVFEFVW